MFKKYLEKFKQPLEAQMLSVAERKRLQQLPRYKHDETTFFGHKLKIVDACTFLSSLDEIFKGEIYKFVPGKSTDVTIIDCGANIGLSTIYFKKNFTNAKVIAFEPDPDIFKVMRDNVASFGYDDVELFNVAVSTKEGEIHFQVEGGHSGMIVPLPEIKNSVSVKCIRLQSFLQKFEKITFLKIDIEGHETQVLPDICEELKKVDFLFLEYHSFMDAEQQLDSILNIIKKAGLRYYMREAYNKPLPFISREIFLNMDFLVNIFCYRD